MKVIFIVLLTTVGPIETVFSQNPELISVIDTSLQIMQANSVNKNTVDWNLLRKKAFTKAKKAENGYQLGDVFRMILKETNDFHGSIFVGDSTFRWIRKERFISDSIKNEWKKGVYLQSKVLVGNVGYIRVPYMPFGDRAKLDKKAQILNDSLCSLLSRNIKGIVLDLRLNGGGAMYPMMLGLKQILGDGQIGSFTSGNSERWLLKNNCFYLDTMLLTCIIPKCNISAKTIPVVVLTGLATGSSGEFLAMSFKGRSNTIFLGEETAGYVTATKGFKINDAVYILISTCYGKDRKGSVYSQALSPDISSNDEDSFNDIDHDKKVMKASDWIQAHN
jgi:C-terminal processing protease CtpA/Prc